MDTKKIKALIKILEESGLTALELTEEQSKIRIEKNISYGNISAPAPVYSVAPAPVREPKSAGEIDFNKISEFKAPLIGVFYSAPSPDAKPFVKIGQRVKRGDVLCIIEAMKVMNEITADRDGEVVDICVQDGQIVEYSQVLFKIF